MKFCIVILLILLFGCDLTDDPYPGWVDINKYPATFPNLETDIAYFQDSTLILYDSKTSNEKVLFKVSEKPNNHFWSANGRYAFYWGSFWFFSGDVYRYDRKNNKEEKLPVGVFSSSYVSFDGEKYISGSSYFNMVTKQRYNVDSVVWDYWNDTSYWFFPYSQRWLTNNTFSIIAQFWRKNDTLTNHFEFVISDSTSILQVNSVRSLPEYSFSSSDASRVYNSDSTYYYYLENRGCVVFACSERRCYIVNTKTNGTIRLFPESDNINYVTFSPSGKQIYFSAWLFNAKGELKSYIFVANVDGSSPALISNRYQSRDFPAFVNTYTD